jgi:hypothetical protein
MTRVLEALGRKTEVEVYLVGFCVEEGDDPIWIESENSSILPNQLQDVPAQGEALTQRHPHSQQRYWGAQSQARMDSQLQDTCRAEALKEALERYYPNGGISFFVGRSAQVALYKVYVAIGVPTNLLVATPTLLTHEKDDLPITSSLVTSAVDAVLIEATKALHAPEPGADPRVIDRPEAEIVRSAAERFVTSLVVLAGESVPTPLYEALNEVSTMRYEQRVGVVHVLLARRDIPEVHRKLTLSHPVGLREHRTVRKLLELSRDKELALLTDGREIYGLGALRNEYDPASESVFSINILGQGTWEIHHGAQGLLHVQYGQPRLPDPRLDREHFIDIAMRVFQDSATCNATALWDLAQAAADAQHGTMLVVSAAKISRQKVGE